MLLFPEGVVLLFVHFSSLDVGMDQELDTKLWSAPSTLSTMELRGAMGGISVIWVKNHFFILLNEFNVNTII